MSRSSRPSRPRVSVVVPTLNEATTIADCLERLRGQGADEVIVADAESPDGTAAIAGRSGAKVVLCPGGRGVQQNRGAASARGDILLFLHADCWLAPDAIEVLRGFSARSPRVPGGCFRMRVEAPDLLFRPIDAAAHLRAGLFGLPYGDQGIFARRWAFDLVGGFPEIPIMEDVHIGMRLRKLGRLALLPATIHVSPRRWRKQGLLAQTLRNWGLTAAAAAGVGTQTLAKFYPAVR